MQGEKPKPALKRQRDPRITVILNIDGDKVTDRFHKETNVGHIIATHSNDIDENFTFKAYIGTQLLKDDQMIKNIIGQQQTATFQLDLIKVPKEISKQSGRSQQSLKYSLSQGSGQTQPALVSKKGLINVNLDLQVTKFSIEANQLIIQKIRLEVSDSQSLENLKEKIINCYIKSEQSETRNQIDSLDYLIVSIRKNGNKIAQSSYMWPLRRLLSAISSKTKNYLSLELFVKKKES